MRRLNESRYKLLSPQKKKRPSREKNQNTHITSESQNKPSTQPTPRNEDRSSRPHDLRLSPLTIPTPTTIPSPPRRRRSTRTTSNTLLHQHRAPTAARPGGARTTPIAETAAAAPLAGSAGVEDWGFVDAGARGVLGGVAGVVGG